MIRGYSTDTDGFGTPPQTTRDSYTILVWYSTPNCHTRDYGSSHLELEELSLLGVGLQSDSMDLFGIDGSPRLVGFRLLRLGFSGRQVCHAPLSARCVFGTPGRGELGHVGHT